MKTFIDSSEKNTTKEQTFLKKAINKPNKESIKTFTTETEANLLRDKQLLEAKDTEKSLIQPKSKEVEILDEISTEKASFDMKGPKQYLISIDKNDLANFDNKIKTRDIEDFINKYLQEHSRENIESKSDFYCVFLVEAILEQNNDIISFILNQSHSTSVLTNINRTGYSPIYAALSIDNDGILSMINQYLKTNCDTLEKVDLTGDNFWRIVAITKNPQQEYLTPEECINEYLTHLYTDQSIEELIKIIGQDYIDSFYY